MTITALERPAQAAVAGAAPGGFKLISGPIERRAARPSKPRVVIAHDYLTQAGGAERVVLSLLEAFPDAPVVTSVYDADGTFPAFRGHDIRTGGLQKVSAFRRDPRKALALLPRAWSSTVIDDADIVLCSSTGFSHGVSTRAPKIVYCHNPARWLHQPDDYLPNQPAPVRMAVRVLDGYLRSWDQQAAQSADRYLANSTVVAERIRNTYGVEADVVHPPSTFDADMPMSQPEGVAPGYLLTIARARGYKNTVVACQAAEALPGVRLVVVGGALPERPGGGEWSERIIGLGRVSDEELAWLYANCYSLVAPAFEDFGLSPIEAATFGKPTIGLRAGGYLDTVQDGRTGLLVGSPTVAGFTNGIQRLERTYFDPAAIKRHAESFSVQRFAATIRQYVDETLFAHQLAAA
ncbi:MAG TPA: glycosyltransferase [Mycobacteriales bacterium]|nr:glycosyltransferase [Mycobacteriales bacterium]